MTPQQYFTKIDSKAEELFNKGIKTLTSVKNELNCWKQKEVIEVCKEIQSLMKE